MPSKIHAVLLAGGRGTRLKPYTTFIPKPLMPIGDLPIIEVILLQLKHAGIETVTIAVGHMAQLLQAFVGDGSRFGLEITYSSEESPLGTAGPLGQIREKMKSYDAVICMNGDVLTTLDYGVAIDAHFESGAEATICLNRRKVDIDFGVVESDKDGHLVAYKEKPTLFYDVSMGINILSPQAIARIPLGKFYNIPDLMIDIKESGATVNCHRQDCYWLDIGRVEDYSTACEIFESRKGEFVPDGR
jgi:NDP-mannose synthase